MKHINFLIIPLAIVSCNILASSSLPPKQISIPFNNEAILSTKHSGLVMNYDMHGNPPKKIVCKLSNIYKSWIEFPEQGAIKESHTFGGGQTVTFTSKGQDQDPDESHSIYHADTTGHIKISDTVRDKTSYATASCFYDIDNSIK